MCDLHRLVQLHNDERTKSSWFSRPRPELQEDDQLFSYAQKWVEYMAHTNKLVHSSMRWIASLGFSNVGENIAYGAKHEEDVMKQWMRSSGHKRNIMDKSFTHIGCGFAKSKKGIPYWCVCFGKK